MVTWQCKEGLDTLQGLELHSAVNQKKQQKLEWEKEINSCRREFLTWWFLRLHMRVASSRNSLSCFSDAFSVLITLMAQGIRLHIPFDTVPKAWKSHFWCLVKTKSTQHKKKSKEKKRDDLLHFQEFHQVAALQIWFRTSCPGLVLLEDLLKPLMQISWLMEIALALQDVVWLVHKELF